MSISSTASASEQPGFAMVSVKGYRLHTTMEMGEMDCAFRSCSSEGMERARMPYIQSRVNMAERGADALNIPP